MPGAQGVTNLYTEIRYITISVVDCNFDAQLGDLVAWLPLADDACSFDATI